MTAGLAYATPTVGLRAPAVEFPRAGFAGVPPSRLRIAMLAPPCRYGHYEAARTIASAMLRAAPYFEHRLPEVFAGYPTSVASVPVAFPTASRPQAWAAGAPLLLLSTLLGLHPGRIDADVEIPCDIGHVALRSREPVG